ncbi:hypothetical protein Pmani_011241 [Petrolisthes manimaculis]|uniref:Uncharacterized protein n=1 Tax=Petrolisthes manimaculis TaxID=1843537 RepID=A0AAE1Q1L3_9EUCA|nr:hypothetical protein Pmani_011241 [Petrolisthes manimaculis]
MGRFPGCSRRSRGATPHHHHHHRHHHHRHRRKRSNDHSTFSTGRREGGGGGGTGTAHTTPATRHPTRPTPSLADSTCSPPPPQSPRSNILSEEEPQPPQEPQDDAPMTGPPRQNSHFSLPEAQLECTQARLNHSLSSDNNNTTASTTTTTPTTQDHIFLTTQDGVSLSLTPLRPHRTFSLRLSRRPCRTHNGPTTHNHASSSTPGERCPSPDFCFADEKENEGEVVTMRRDTDEDDDEDEYSERSGSEEEGSEASVYEAVQSEVEDVIMTTTC